MSNSNVNSDAPSLHQVTEFLGKKYLKSIDAVPEDQIPVLEIFKTVEGEGTHIGTPRVLARVAGCAVMCRWCDTKYSWRADWFRNDEGEKVVNENLTIHEFCDQIQEVAEGHTTEISITGGEPMHYPKQMVSIARELRARGFTVSLETSGTILSDEVFAEFDFVSLDVKTPSSQVPVPENLIHKIQRMAYTHRGVQVKAVISNEADLKWVGDNFQQILKPTDPTIRHFVLTPCADNTKGEVAPEILNELTAMILEWNQSYHCRIITQQHKLLGYE